MPSGYEPLLTGAGKLLRDSWPIDEVYHKGLKRWVRLKPWFLKKKYLGWAIAKGLVVPPTIPKRRKRRRRSKDRHVRFLTCRFRDTNPTNLSLDEKFTGFPGQPGAIVIKTITNGQVTNTFQQWLGGTPSGKLTRKQTWDCTNPGPPFKNGGAFSKIEYSIPSSKPWVISGVTNLGAPGSHPGNYKKLDAKIYDTSNWGGDLPSSYLITSMPKITGYDSLAWDKLKPRVSPGNLTQFLVELRDLPRMLETSANSLWNSYRSFGGGYSRVVMHPKSVADNFLNHEFGWAPFLSDIQKLYELYVNTEKYISNLVRLNNTWQRRSAVLEETETLLQRARFYGLATNPAPGFDFNQMCRPMVVDGVDCFGLTEIHERNYKRVWAEGSFKYYRPEFDDSLVNFGGQLQNINRLMTLYGLRINPTVIWKLTPWTWAVDWFTQVGSFIQHHDEYVNDGIVSRYLYIMRNQEKFVTKTCMANFWSGPRSCTWQRNLSQKQRVCAESPYGFDRPWNTLSPRQIGILGSIGITRTPDGFVSRG